MDQPVSFNYEHGALHTPTRDALLPSPTTAQPKSEYLRQKLRERREDLGMTDDSLRQLSLSEPKPVRGMDDYIFESEEDHKKNRRRQRGQASRVSSAASQYAGGNPSRSQSYSMGSREQQTSMDKMSKDNFDLKLRLTLVEERGHRLETELEEALEKIDTLQAIEEERDELHEENAVLCDRVEELQQSNDACEQKLRDSWRMNGEVFAELEKRDVAIKEALDIVVDSEHPEGSVLNDDNKDTRSDMTQFEDEDLTTPTASEAPTIPTEYRPGQYPQWPGTGGKYGFGRDLFFNGDGLDDVPRGRR
ncbi:Spindle associated protein [Neofusicoccum parvum]|uniref:Spindle associated protein n=1 Tax=Neofusicoccum parvum TaxID=310453 RepID=A0ACB5SHI2_9PEZI|nr:Spindle associated protein [Neofusicoccum parvum]